MIADDDRMNERRWCAIVARHAAIIGLFLVLGVGLTYPLVVNFTTAIPGTSNDHDVATFVWNLWWTRHALLDLHTNLLSTDYVFYPFTIDLRLHTYGLLYSLISIPFQLLLGVVGAFNLLILLTVALNGYATCLLGRYALGRSTPALIAGALVASNPALTFHLRVGRPSLAAIWPAALALLLLGRFAKARRWRDATGLGLAMLTALWIDFHILLFTALWLAIYGMYLLVCRRASVLNWRFVGGTLLALAIVGIPFRVIFYPALVGAGSRGYPVPTAQDTLPYSLYVKLFVTPWFLRLTFGIVLPVVVVLACLTSLQRQVPAFWLAGGLVFLVLTLGIVLQPTQIPLPFAALRALPGMAQFRTPYRFNVPAVLGLALAADDALAYWQARLVPARWHPALTVCLLGLILLDSRAVAPFAVQTYPDQSVYHRIADEPGDFTVLEIPVGVRSGIDIFGHGDNLQFYQTIHGKRMINGMIARVPRHIFEYYRGWPALQLLAGEPVSDGVDVDANFTELMRGFRVGYVVVHPSLLEPPALERIDRLLTRQPELKLVEKTATVRVYQVLGVED